MASQILTYSTLFLCLVVFVRMFTYQREGARFRRDISIMAGLIMACCGAMIVYILAGDYRVHPHGWPLVAMLAILTASLMRCEGNLSHVLRMASGWDGRERRHR